MKVSIGKAARDVVVHPETLQQWKTQGNIVMERTPTWLRRYDGAQLHCLGPHKALSARVTLRYARVSSHDQKDDIARPVASLESFPSPTVGRMRC